MKILLGFEFSELFKKTKLLLYLLLLILLCVFLLDGARLYKKSLDNKEPFVKTEKEKTKQFLNYTQYGTRGLHLLCLPHSFSSLFSDSAVYSGLTAHVDTGEGLYIHNSYKGKSLFALAGGYMDFGGVIMLLGVFFAMLYGYDSTKNSNYLKLLKDLSGLKNISLWRVFIRTILFNLVACLLVCLPVVILSFFVGGLLNIFLLVFLCVLCLMNAFFIAAGAFIGDIRVRISKPAILAAVYLVFIFLIPWGIQKIIYSNAVNIKSVYQLELDELSILMDFEKLFYEKFNTWRSGGEAPDAIKKLIEESKTIVYKRLQEYEAEMLKQQKEKISEFHFLAAFFPTTFYISINRELSSKGYLNFVDFYEFASKTKHTYVDFYLEKKFFNPPPKGLGVESFIKGEENVFMAKPSLPNSFLLGFLVMLFYIGLPIFFMYRLREKDSAKEIKEPLIVFDTKQTAMIVLCKDDSIKSDIFRYYKTLDTAACIDLYSENFKQNGYSAKTVLRYFSRLAGVNIERAEKHLALLGIEDLNNTSLSPEDILKIYAAVKISGDSVKYVVFNDFFKMKSRRFEDSFRSLISQLEEQDIKIIYLSCEMPYPKTALHELINIKRFETYSLDFKNVTLR